MPPPTPPNPADPSLGQAIARKVIHSFPPTARDKVVPFLLPTPVATVEPLIEPAAPNIVPSILPSNVPAVMPSNVPAVMPTLVPQTKEAQAPIESLHQIPIPSLVPSTIEPEITPAFDQLAISRNISTGICSVASGEIPNFNSLLNAESSSHTQIEDDQQSSSSSSVESSTNSDNSDNEMESAPQSRATAQKEIPFFGPN